MPEEDLAKLKIDKSETIVMPTQRKKKRLAVIVILVLILSAAGLYVSGIIAPATSVDITTISQVYPAQSLSVLNASGYIVAQRKAAVSSKVTGRLEALMVEEGSKVRRGQVIARLENADVMASRAQVAANINTSRALLEQAKAERDDAFRDYTRFKKLVAGGSIARSQFDSAEARYLRAVAAVNAAEATVTAGVAALQGADAAIGYTSIVAPFDGVVLTKNADIGDIVTPIGAAANAKSAVVTIADMDSLQVEVDVSETGIGAIKAGQPCDIQLDAIPNIHFRGQVHTVVPTVDRSKATVLVKVRFLDKDPQMLPDMSAKVSFLSRPLKPEEQRPRLAANQDAVMTRDGRSLVYLIDKDRVKETPVTVGAKLGDMVEILTGLKPGDRAVLKPPKNLKDGTKIKISEK
jgi:RND family efflux transporter MFP subunit